MTKCKIIVFILIVFVILFSSCNSEIDNDITEKVKNVLKLSTIEAAYRQVAYFENTTFLWWTKKTLFSIDVIIKAGVDLKEGFEVIPVDDETVKLRLPPAKLLLVDADEPSIYEYFTNGSIFGDIIKNDINKLIYELKEGAKKDAVEKRGLLYIAEENLKKILKNIIIQSGYKNVIFEEMNILIENDPKTEE